MRPSSLWITFPSSPSGLCENSWCFIYRSSLYYLLSFSSLCHISTFGSPYCSYHYLMLFLFVYSLSNFFKKMSFPSLPPADGMRPHEYRVCFCLTVVLCPSSDIHLGTGCLLGQARAFWSYSAIAAMSLGTSHILYVNRLNERCFHIYMYYLGQDSPLNFSCLKSRYHMEFALAAQQIIDWILYID